MEEFEHFNVTEEDATKDRCGYFSQSEIGVYVAIIIVDVEAWNSYLYLKK